MPKQETSGHAQSILGMLRDAQDAGIDVDEDRIEELEDEVRSSSDETRRGDR